MQTGQGQMDRERIHATTQQRDQIRTCDRTADGLRKQARKMAQASENKFDADQARLQHAQIRSQFQTMEREHQRLIAGLDSNQQQAWQKEIQNMNQIRQRINSQLEQMDSDLRPANPDPKRVLERAREMERTTSEWREQYKALSSQIQP